MPSTLGCPQRMAVNPSRKAANKVSFTCLKSISHSIGVAQCEPRRCEYAKSEHRMQWKMPLPLLVMIWRKRVAFAIVQTDTHMVHILMYAASKWREPPAVLACDMRSHVLDLRPCANGSYIECHTATQPVKLENPEKSRRKSFQWWVVCLRVKQGTLFLPVVQPRAR